MKVQASWRWCESGTSRKLLNITSKLQAESSKGESIIGKMVCLFWILSTDGFPSLKGMRIEIFAIADIIGM
ncbi:MAG: hypothetical protein ACERKZ_10105 [Lachnotalea sp.]